MPLFLIFFLLAVVLNCFSCTACISKTHINLTSFLFKSKFLSLQICNSAHFLSHYFDYYNYFCFYSLWLFLHVLLLFLIFIVLWCQDINIIASIVIFINFLISFFSLFSFIIIIIIIIIIMVLFFSFYFWLNNFFFSHETCKVSSFFFFFLLRWNCRIIIQNFITFLLFTEDLHFSSFISILT